MKKFLLPLLCLLISACGPSGGLPETKPPVPRAPYPYSKDIPPLKDPRQPEVVKERVPIAGGDIVKIALLLPLTGESGALGQAMADAGMLALYDRYLALNPDKKRVQVTIIPKDTGTTPAGAEKAAREAIAEGASLILGPLFSQSVPAVTAVAKPKNIPVITFSNNVTIAQEGVYVFGFIPEQQVERVSEYAFLQGITRFASLAPNDPFGQKVTQIFAQTINKQGGVARPIELYSPRPANLDSAMAKLAATYNSAEEDRKFEALFIPEGGQQIGHIIDALKRNQLNREKIRLLGTGLWDERDVVKSADLVGGWFASSPPEYVAWFEKRFVASYSYKPQRLAGLAYDAVALACALALNPSGPDFSQAALTDTRGYLGPANGLFRFQTSGLSERRLSVMEITPGGFKTVDPAPKSF